MRCKKAVLFFVFFFFAFFAKPLAAEEVSPRYIRFIGGIHKWKMLATIAKTEISNCAVVVLPSSPYSKARGYCRHNVSVKQKSLMQAYDGKEHGSINGFNNKQNKFLKDKRETKEANVADGQNHKI